MARLSASRDYRHTLHGFRGEYGDKSIGFCKLCGLVWGNPIHTDAPTIMYDPKPVAYDRHTVTYAVDSGGPVAHVREEDPMPSREVIQSQLTYWAEKLQRIQRFPEEEPEVGTVLGFKKKFAGDGTEYEYVALHASNGFWYLTGSFYREGARTKLSWNQLVEVMAAGVEGDVLKATEWEKFA